MTYKHRKSQKNKLKKKKKSKIGYSAKLITKFVDNKIDEIFKKYPEFTKDKMIQIYETMIGKYPPTTNGDESILRFIETEAIKMKYPELKKVILLKQTRKVQHSVNHKYRISIPEQLNIYLNETFLRFGGPKHIVTFGDPNMQHTRKFNRVFDNIRYVWEDCSEIVNENINEFFNSKLREYRTPYYQGTSGDLNLPRPPIGEPFIINNFVKEQSIISSSLDTYKDINFKIDTYIKRAPEEYEECGTPECRCGVCDECDDMRGDAWGGRVLPWQRTQPPTPPPPEFFMRLSLHNHWDLSYRDFFTDIEIDMLPDDESPLRRTRINIMENLKYIKLRFFGFNSLIVLVKLTEAEIPEHTTNNVDVIVELNEEIKNLFLNNLIITINKFLKVVMKDIKIYTDDPYENPIIVGGARVGFKTIISRDEFNQALPQLLVHSTNPRRPPPDDFFKKKKNLSYFINKLNSVLTDIDFISTKNADIIYFLNNGIYIANEILPSTQGDAP